MVAPLELRTLLQCFGMFLRFSLVLRLSQRQQMRVFWRKHECLHEFKTFVAQPPTDYHRSILPGKFTKIVRVDDPFLDARRLHDAAFEPSIIDPLLYLSGADV
jgi:hypothetical protein